jgi:hypothetical protein
VVFSETMGTSALVFKSTQSVERQTSRQLLDQNYELKREQFCLEQRCQILVRWDSSRLIGFDPITGATLSHWIEQ